MATKRPVKVRENFHQAKWDEELIFELHKPGERGIVVAPVEKGIAAEVGDGLSALPAHMVRRTPPALPEVEEKAIPVRWEETVSGESPADSMASFTAT